MDGDRGPDVALRCEATLIGDPIDDTPDGDVTPEEVTEELSERITGGSRLAFRGGAGSNELLSRIINFWILRNEELMLEALSKKVQSLLARIE